MIQVLRETHETPNHVREQVTRAGGLNWLGEANFRVVWGGSRLAWIGGRWTDHDASGNVIRETTELRKEPKYVPVNRWYIERWMPPEAYGSPDEWFSQTIEIENGIKVSALGPYPSRGEYEHCFTLQSSNGEFLQLSPTACDWIVCAVEWARRRPHADSKLAIAEREMGRERDWETTADEILSDPKTY